MKVSNNKAGLVTAYESNARKSVQKEVEINSGWADKIDDLLRQDYSFLGYKYSTNSVLFRGMGSGLLKAIESNAFGLYESDNPHAGLEQTLRVHFVSHELSDALTTARLWEEVDDAGIVVVSSNWFNHCYDEKQAAMMATAEPGFVFKYPFFVTPVPLEKILSLFVNGATYNRLQQNLPNEKFASLQSILVIIRDKEFNLSRTEFETSIQQILIKRDYQAAIPEATEDFPKKINNYK